MTSMTSDETRLIAIERRIADAVCSVHGVVLRSEIELCYKLRAKVGRRYCAVNERWEALDTDD
jgi:hypothetical protein